MHSKRFFFVASGDYYEIVTPEGSLIPTSIEKWTTISRLVDELNKPLEEFEQRQEWIDGLRRELQLIANAACNIESDISNILDEYLDED